MSFSLELYTGDYVIDANMDKKEQGKRNKINGAKFELKVRRDLESRGWIVTKWANNIEEGKLIPAKRAFNAFRRVMTIGSGFPDFLAYKIETKEIIGVEAKSNGYLKPEEKEKCKWLLENGIFQKILIASKNNFIVNYSIFSTGIETNPNSLNTSI